MKLIKGRNSTYTVTVRDGDAVKNLTACPCYFQIKNTIDSAINLLQITGVSASPTTGVVVFTINAVDFAPIENRIYPYQIYYVDNLLQDQLVETGSVTICPFNDSAWEWTYPYFSGKNRQDVVNELISQVPYNSFTDADIFRWLANGMERFCRETDYNICTVSRETLYGIDSYSLPTSLISVIKVEIKDQTAVEETWIELDSDLDWEQVDGKIKFSNRAGFLKVADAGTYKIKSGQTFRIKASKYCQPLTNDIQFIELPKDCFPAMILYCAWFGKLQDREPEEAAKYENLYLQEEARFKLKNNKDNVKTCFITYAGQGESVI